jgi:hypothetical protein
MKILMLLFLLTACSVFQSAADYCKEHPLECKGKKKIHDTVVQAAQCRDLEWVTERDYGCEIATPKQ